VPEWDDEHGRAHSPRLAANMRAAFKKVWGIIGATDPGDFDRVMNRIVELANERGP
jgi:hypothetical protein